MFRLNSFWSKTYTGAPVTGGSGPGGTTWLYAPGQAPHRSIVRRNRTVFFQFSKVALKFATLLLGVLFN